MRHSFPGRLIALEGTEGVGKSTCFEWIEQYLDAANIPYQMTREPGGTQIAEEIRGILLRHHAEPMHPDAEALLLFASRAQHLAQVIVPALKEGRWVVTDRYIDSSYAYQGSARGLGYERIAQLQQWLSLYVEPDLVFLLEAPIEMTVERVRRRHTLDRFEREQMDFFKKVQEGYHYRAALASESTARIDATQTLEQMRAQMEQALNRLRGTQQR